MLADTQYLILVDDADKQWGKMEKMEVHRLGLLHRAFSVFLFNSQGELLLQQRADSKYHSPGLWTNTCCSHPQFGEELNDAIKRRLDEELGMTAETRFAFSFIYKITFDNELIEHEFDHVYFGVSDMIPVPNPDEIKNWKYMDIEAIAADLDLHPERYTEWFKICFKRAADVYQTLYGYSYGL